MGNRFQPLFREMGKKALYFLMVLVGKTLVSFCHLDRGWWFDRSPRFSADSHGSHFCCSMKCWGIPGGLPVYQCIIMDYWLSPCFSPFSHGYILVYPIFNVSLPKLGQESSTGTSACSRPYRMPSTSRYLVWRWANGSWGVLEIEWFEILGITPECMCRICIICIICKYYILNM